MGSESAKAWRTVLEDLIARGLQPPAFLIVDSAPGPEKAIAAVLGRRAGTALHCSQASQSARTRARSTCMRKSAPTIPT
jgi:Transposase, Mutator family